jgi:hypothetical protein
MEGDENVLPVRPRSRPTLTQRIFRFTRRYGLWLFLAVLVLCSAGSYELGRYTVYQAHPGLSGQDQANAILGKVGALIQLPQNETPTMATITDAAAVKSTQPFLANAENGDVLIVYPNAETALLYRPSTNKLIAVGPVTSGAASQPTEQETPIPVAPAEPEATASSTTDASSSKSTK